MKNHYLSRFFIFTIIVLLFALLMSQQGLSARAADSAQVETGTATVTATATVSPTTTVTTTTMPTITPTPGCDLVDGGAFIVIGNDDLLFTVTNNNINQVYLTSTTLYWTDYYDPNMLVDYFLFGSTQYWNGNGFDSPSTQTSNVMFPSLTIFDWNLDFDGYGDVYGQTHTIGPFTLELTFNNQCVVTASILPVVSQITNPVDRQIITDKNQTAFEVSAWDTGVGTQNGAGINLAHIVILDSSGNVIVNRNDTSVPFCAWGNQSPCPEMSATLWNSLPNGVYQMIAWSRSSVTASWSPPHVVNFKILRLLPPRPTETPLPYP